MNTLDEKYKRICEHILDNGSYKSTRNGNVYSVFGLTIRHDMSEGFPILTTKHVSFKNIVTELLWFLNGRTDLKWLLDRNCHIWSGDAYKRYVDKTSDNSSNWNQWMYSNGDGSYRMFTLKEFEEKIQTDNRFEIMWDSFGSIYGHSWRNYGGKKLTFKMKDLNGNDFPGQEPLPGIDQIQNLINTLKTNPDDRRMIVNSWDVSKLNDMLLPPCHYSFQVYTEGLNVDERLISLIKMHNFDPAEIGVGSNIPAAHIHAVCDSYDIPRRKISLLWNQRSVDVPLGLSYNIASYGLLLSILAKEVNVVPGELIGNLGDCHIYENQIEGIKEQLLRYSYDLPNLKIQDKDINDIAEYELNDFTLENYQYHPAIKMPLSN